MTYKSTIGKGFTVTAHKRDHYIKKETTHKPINYNWRCILRAQSVYSCLRDKNTEWQGHAEGKKNTQKLIQKPATVCANWLNPCLEHA